MAEGLLKQAKPDVRPARPPQREGSATTIFRIAAARRT